jgi:tetratricopeptide (TPR) repeat protein
MEKEKNPRECHFYNNFLKCIDSLKEAEGKYKCHCYKDALNLLKESLDKIQDPSSYILSQYYDMVASILWKIGDKDKAHVLWEKSLSYDGNNRHSSLSLSILYEKDDYLSVICELFIKLKLNEYYSMKNMDEDKACDPYEEEKIMNYLLQFWKNNLSSLNLENMDELEMVDYFINLKVF